MIEVEENDSPVKIRQREVLYYRPNSKIKNYKDYLKEYNYDEYTLTYADRLDVRYGILEFATFDDAVNFIDNLGCDDMLINAVSITQRIWSCNLQACDYFNNVYFIPGDHSPFTPTQFIFRNDIYSISDRLSNRLDIKANNVGESFKVNMQYTGYRYIDYINDVKDSLILKQYEFKS